MSIEEQAESEVIEDVIEEVEPEDVDGERPEADTEETDSDEITVTIAGESPAPDEHKDAPEWVRELRKQHRELKREKAALEERLAAVSAPKQEQALGPKPTLEALDYDTEAYEQQLAAWYDRKREADAKARQAEQAQREQEEAWKHRVEQYAQAKQALKVRDFDEAEDTVKELFNATQQGVLLHGAEKPELLVYALGKNAKKAAELATITDPVKFAFAVAKLEAQLKVTDRKAPPAPEKIPTGNGRPSGTVDSTLERLRAEAEKTGDFSKVMSYKRQQRNK